MDRQMQKVEEGNSNYDRTYMRGIAVRLITYI